VLCIAVSCGDSLCQSLNPEASIPKNNFLAIAYWCQAQTGNPFLSLLLFFSFSFQGTFCLSFYKEDAFLSARKIFFSKYNTTGI